MRRVLYPGSFDPITNGHLDVINRAARLFNEVVVGVAINEDKQPLFTTVERVDLLKEVTKDIKNVKVVSFSGLLIDAVDNLKAFAVIRGLRAVSDFEFEFQMALMNRELSEECETIFMMPSTKYSFVSSRLIKEIANNNGDVTSFVPKLVDDTLKNKLK